MRPSVSVIIPCYNHAEFLGEAIASAKAQTYAAVEIIVIDDGSADASAQIARDCGVTLIQQPNAGPAKARNAGIAAASGDYILPLDADDTLERTCLEKLADLASSSGADIAAPSYALFGDEQGTVYTPDPITHPTQIPGTSLIRRSKLLEVGGYDESFRIGWEDYEMWIRMLKAGATVAPTREVLFGYRSYGQSRSHTARANIASLEDQVVAKHPELRRALRLAICIPWSKETVPTKFFDRVIGFKYPENCEWKWIRGQGDTAARRHVHCCEQALGWGADAILILGVDQVYHDRDMIPKLVAHYREGRDCVCAMVPMRGVTPSQGTKPFEEIAMRHKADANGNVTLRPGDNILEHFEIIKRSDGPLIRCHGIGSGVFLFPAEVLARLAKPWFFEIRDQETQQRITCADTPFTSRLQMECGLQIWLDTTIRVTHLQEFEIDGTFAERFKDWTYGIGDQSMVESAPASVYTNIAQVRVSPAIPLYKERFQKRYGLAEYSNPNLPAFFFGLYGQTDFDALNQHRSHAVVIWTGSDILCARQAAEQHGTKLVFGGGVYHVAISQFIANDLDALGLKYVRLPFCCVDESKFQPTPRGKAVYCLLPEHSDEKYGGPLLREIMAKMPGTEFIVVNGHDQFGPEQMTEIYAKCGVGLRLTKHDGLSNTVVEMGLMGRMVLWGGDTPNARPVSSDIDGLCNDIRYLMTNGIDGWRSTSDAMREFLKMPDGWNQVSHYTPAAPQNGHAPQGIIPPSVAGKPYGYQSYFDARYEGGELGAGGPDPVGKEASWTRYTVNSLIAECAARNVLDVGCGSAARWDRLPLQMCAGGYIGIDVSPKAIEHARARFPKSDFRCLDVTREDILTADVVLCIDVLQHIRHEDFEAVMKRLMGAAQRRLIIKTSIDIPENFYQFSHSYDRWMSTRPGDWSISSVQEVPDSVYGRLFVFDRIHASDGTDPTGRPACEEAIPIAPALHIAECV